MNQNKIDLNELGYTDDELFSVVDNNTLDSEKITAPRYSYWQSVFRVFFRKKINIIILSVLALLLLFTYIYPVVIDYDPEYDPYVNVNTPGSTHLSPKRALGKFGEIYVEEKVVFKEGEKLGKKLDKEDNGYEVVSEKTGKKLYEVYEIVDEKTGEKSYITKNFSLVVTLKNMDKNIHWILGAGDAGQSTFDSIWYGSSISVTLALVCAAINLVIGILIGAVWGFSKKFDVFMIEVYNIVANVPYILLISVIVLIMSASFWAMVFALTITGWISIAYFIRTQVIIIRDREYNLASKCLGTPIWRIATKNILPFMTSVIVTIAATEIPSYISYEVFLSYIGMGLKDMSLGKLIEASQSSMLVPGWGFEFWSPVTIASIIAVVLYVVGQNLGDASDPRTHM